MRVLPLLLLTACAASGVLEPIEDTATAAPPPPPPPQSACGAVSTWDLTVEGVVVDAAGDPIARAVVRLEDRAWTPGDVLGEALSDVHGGFRLPVSGLTAVEDCWGTLLDYVLTGTTDTAYAPSTRR